MIPVKTPLSELLEVLSEHEGSVPKALRPHYEAWVKRLMEALTPVAMIDQMASIRHPTARALALEEWAEALELATERSQL